MSVLVWSNSDILKDYFLICPLISAISAWFAKGFRCTWGRFLSEDVKFESVLDVHIKNETEKCSPHWECSRMTGRKPSYPWRSWECLEKHPPTLTSLEGLFPGGCCCSHLLHNCSTDSFFEQGTSEDWQKGFCYRVLHCGFIPSHHLCSECPDFWNCTLAYPLDEIKSYAKFK